MLTPSVNVVQSSFAETDQGEISGLSRSVSNLGSSPRHRHRRHDPRRRYHQDTRALVRPCDGPPFSRNWSADWTGGGDDAAERFVRELPKRRPSLSLDPCDLATDQSWASSSLARVLSRVASHEAPPTPVGRGLLWCGGPAPVRTGHGHVLSAGSQFLALDASVRGMNGAMRSHNAADQSHLRRPSARRRRQSRGPQRSIPNRPLRR